MKEDKTRYTIPDKIQKKWKQITDILVKVIEVPVALILTADHSYIEVSQVDASKKKAYAFSELEPILNSYCEEVKKNRKPLHISNRLKDERWRSSADVHRDFVSFLGYPLEWPNGDLFATLCVLDTDIREYQETAKNLLEVFKEQVESHLQLLSRQRQFKSVFEELNDPVLIHTEEGDFLLVNEAATEYLGYEREEWSSLTLKDIIAKSSAEKIEKRKEKLQEEGSLVFESIHISKDGDFIPVETSTTRIEFQDKNAYLSIVRDISERKKAIENLKRSEKRFRRLTEAAPDPVYQINQKGKFVFVNEAFCQKIGYPKEKILSLSLKDPIPFLSEKNRNKVMRNFKKRMKGYDVSPYILKVKLKNRETRYVEINANTIIEDNQIIGEIGIARDITNLKETEERLERSEQKYRSLVETTSDGILVYDLDGNIEFFNQGALGKLGYSREELQQKNISELVPKEYYDVLNKLREERKEGDTKTHRFEMEFLSKKGKRIPVDISSTPIMRDQNIEKIMGSARDITQRKELEQKLEALHTWSLRLNQADTMDEIFKETLDAMEQILGFKYAAIAMKQGNVLKFKAHRGYGSFPNRLQKLPLDGKGISVKAFNTGKSFLIKNVNDNPAFLPPPTPAQEELTAPIKVSDEVIGVLDAHSNEANTFTRQDKHLLETLAAHVGVAINQLWEKEKRVSLERLDKLRNQFLAMAAHEINTPLTPLRSRLEMLREGYRGDLTKEQIDTVDSILASVKRLERLVNDFRRISRLRTGQIKLQKQEHKLVNTIDEALKKFSPVFEEENIILIKNVQKPYTAVYDHDRLVQVIRNVVENAIDYTKDHIWIRAWENGSHICFSVRDNGIGIPQDQQDKIFQPFHRVEKGRERSDRRYGGTGLGLTICKRIIEAHGGKIKVDSQQGKGSKFTVCIPKFR